MNTHANWVAIVTGAAGGIGRETASLLADRGATVGLVDVNDAVAEVAEELQAEGHEAIGITADVSRPEEVEAAHNEIVEAFGAVDILVNNAGIASNTDRVIEMDTEAYRKDIEINLLGMFLWAKRCLPPMVENGRGRIVNISSGTATMGGFGQAGYASSKAGVLGLTKTIALEHARDNITCNAIIPGLIETGIHGDFREDLVERMEKQIPSGEWGQPEDIANAIAFLSKDESKYINGEDLNVDAGIRLFTY